MDEFAIGFWWRFITHYPTRMWSGKSGAFTFVSRLTSNNPYAEGGTGN